MIMFRYLVAFYIYLLATPIYATQITLQNDEVLTVEIVEIQQNDMIVEHELLGTITIPVDAIKFIKHSDDKKTVDKIVKFKIKNTDWKNNLAAGVAIQSGNTKNQSFNFQLQSNQERVTDKTSAEIRYLYGKEDNEKNTNKFSSGVIKDWFIKDSQWSIFAKAKLDYDEFNTWEYRLSAHNGGSYRLLRREHLSTFVRVGLGLAKEFNSNRTNIIPESLFGGDLEWQINRLHMLTVQTTFFPDLDDFGEFRNTTNLNLRLRFSENSNFSMNLGVYNEYQSSIIAPIKKNNLQLFSRIAYTF